MRRRKKKKSTSLVQAQYSTVLNASIPRYQFSIGLPNKPTAHHEWDKSDLFHDGLLLAHSLYQRVNGQLLIGSASQWQEKL